MKRNNRQHIARLIRTSNGFSVPELLVTMTIISFVAIVTVQFFTSGMKWYNLTMAKMTIQRDARTTLDILNRNLRQAVSSTVVIDEFDANQPPYSQIQFDTIRGRSYTFYQKGNKLYLSFDGTTKILTDTLRYIAFSYPRTDDLTILSTSLTLEKASYSGQTKALQLSIEKVRMMN